MTYCTLAAQADLASVNRILVTLTIKEQRVPSQSELEQFFVELERQLISVQRAAALSGLAEGHVRHLLQQKQLAGVKLGRDWWTTAAAVEVYIKSERRPGPKTS